MGVISIRFSNEIEKKIQQEAKIEGKSLSAYCKDVILEGHQEQEQPLNRASIESKIDELKHHIESTNRNISTVSRILLEQSLLNSELSMEFLELAIGGDEEKKLYIYNEARAHARERLKSYFT